MKNKSKTIALISLISLSLFGCKRGTYANPNGGGNGGNGYDTSEKGEDKSSTEEKDSTEKVSSSSASALTPDADTSDEGEPKDSSTPEEAVAPIYQGMIIQNAIQKQVNATAMDVDVSNFVTSFPDIESTNKVDYCVHLNEKIQLLVKFHNLDKTKINSITVNGKKYDVTSDMTTLEGVTLEVDAYTKSGYDTLTLTNISYTDSLNTVGSFDDEHKLTLGVSYENTVSAKVSSKTVKADNASFTLAFADIESIPSNGKVYAYLSSGSGNPVSQELTIGADKNATISFTDLEFGKDYYFGVAASFDLYDGNGLHYAWLVKENITTLSTFSFDSVSVSQTSISFGIKSGVDDDPTAYVSKVILMNDGKEEKTIAKAELGETNSFSDLLSDHSYVLVLEYVYNGKSYTVKYDAKTDAKTAPTISVKTSDVKKKSFSYEVNVTDIDTVGTIDSVSLISGTGENITETELKADDGAILMKGDCSELLANGSYSIKVKYHYDLNDGKGVIKEETKTKITLEETLAPALTLSVDQDEMTVSFKYEVTDTDDIDFAVDKVELLDGTEVEKSITDIANNEGSFTGLYSDQEYSVRVSYHYDLGDGNGVQNKVEAKTAKTKAMSAPSIAINANETGKDFISGSVSISQEYNIVSNVKVTCTERDGLTGELDDKTTKEITGTSFEFTGLKSLTSYHIVCTYDYTLNTKGEKELQHGTKELDRKTSLDVTVSNLELSNTRAIEVGATVYMSMDIHNGNSYNVQVTSIKVNGKTLDDESFIVTGNDDGSIRFKMKTDESDLEDYENQTENGETKFTVEKVTVVNTYDNETYDVYLNGNNTVSAKVFGRVNIEKTYFADADNNKIDYFTNSDDVYVIVELKNKYGYDIKKINDSSDIEQVGNDKTKYRFKYNASSDNTGFKVLNVSSLYYESEYTGSDGSTQNFNKKYTVDNMFAKGYIVSDKTVHSVTSWSDFYGMEDDYVYKLTTNLDFKGTKNIDLVDNGKTFNGVFDGDGYSIKNLKFASTVENQDVKLGLFKSGDMILSNLKLENTYFGLDLSNYDTTTTRTGYVGGFIAEADKAIISNCMIDEYSSIDFENNTIDSFSGGSYVGGFVGYLGQYGEINDCVNESYVSSLNGYVGGFTGYMAGSMNHCYNVGTTKFLKKSVAGSIGAFTGYFNRWSPVSKISNSVNLGPDRFYSSTQRLIGTCYSDRVKKGQTSNVYSLSKLYDGTYDKNNNINRLNRTDISADFFEKTLSFDAGIWDMTKVDYKNKIYPTLKVFDK